MVMGTFVCLFVCRLCVGLSVREHISETTLQSSPNVHDTGGRGRVLPVL